MFIKASTGYSIALCLLTCGAAVACSSSGDSTTPTPNGNTAGNQATAGTAGTPGTGGMSSAGTPSTGGTPSTAGTPATGGNATAGNAGSGSGGAPSTMCAGMKPASSLITSFEDLVANPMNAGQFTYLLGLPGGTFAYQAGALTVTDASKALNVKGNVKAYDGFGVYTGACTDASAYTGVSFSIKGKVGPGGKLNFRVQTNADMPVDTVNKKGACVVPAGTTDTYPLCHPSSFDIPVTEEAKTIEVKFSDLAGGVPVAAVNGSDIVGFEWAFAWAGAADTAYDVDVTLDDLKFTGGSAVGGAGGMGGASSGGAGGNGGMGGG